MVLADGAFDPPWDEFPYKKRPQRACAFPPSSCLPPFQPPTLHHKGKVTWAHSKMVATYKPTEESYRTEASHAGTQILDSQFPELELWESDFLSFKPTVLWQPKLTKTEDVVGMSWKGSKWVTWALSSRTSLEKREECITAHGSALLPESLPSLLPPIPARVLL